MKHVYESEDRWAGKQKWLVMDTGGFPGVGHALVVAALVVTQP